MEGQRAKTDTILAYKQWTNLRAIIETHAKVVLEPPQRNLPDMVFTANAGLVLRDKVIISRFRSPERQGEEPHNHAWFAQNGFEILDWPQGLFFEGAGDALFDRGQDLLWAGHGFRSDALHLIDPRFYHLDTCLCPLARGYLLYFPAAFDEKSKDLIESLVPSDKRIAVEEADALKFCCNAIDLGTHIVLNDAAEALQERLRIAGFTPVISALSEFMKAGGAAKCLTLKLVEA